MSAERQALITRRPTPVTGSFGQCKRNPVGLGSAEYGEYPRTSPSDSCGEWKGKGLETDYLKPIVIEGNQVSLSIRPVQIPECIPNRTF